MTEQRTEGKWNPWAVIAEKDREILWLKRQLRDALTQLDLLLRAENTEINQPSAPCPDQREDGNQHASLRVNYNS